jgi:hypothetical protein
MSYQITTKVTSRTPKTKTAFRFVRFNQDWVDRSGVTKLDFSSPLFSAQTSGVIAPQIVI